MVDLIIMVIGFDGSRAFLKKRTGTEEYSYQLLKHLAEIDRVNKYLVYLRPDSVVSSSGWPANFEFKVINYQRLWTQVGLSLQTFKDFLDVLFVPAHTLPVIRNPRLKTVVTVHDLGSEYLPAMHQIKQRLYLSFMQKIQLKSATKIIAVSNATKEDLVKKIGISRKKVEVVYEGFNEKLFKQVKNDALVDSLRYYNLQPIHPSFRGNNYYLFVGTVQPRKNLERMVRAFAEYVQSLVSTRQSNSHPAKAGSARSALGSSKLEPFGASRFAQTETDLRSDFAPSLVIVGAKGWMSDRIYQLPKELGIEDRVKFLGYVPEKDLPALYSGAIAFLYPSLFEGFGLPILEAQACGCPVITSNLSSMPEVACLPAGRAGKGAILVNPYSVEEIAEGMKKMEDRRRRMEIIKKGYENIKRFSWEKCAKETLKVLEGVI